MRNPFADRIAVAKLDLAQRIADPEQTARLREWIANAENAVLLACPACGSHEQLRDITIYPGTCAGEYARLGDGTIDFEGCGETDIHWDAGEAPANNVECHACQWEGKQEDLILARDEDEDEHEECEDCQVNGWDCETHGEAKKLAYQAAHADPERTVAVLRATGLAE